MYAFGNARFDPRYSYVEFVHPEGGRREANGTREGQVGIKKRKEENRKRRGFARVGTELEKGWNTVSVHKTDTRRVCTSAYSTFAHLVLTHSERPSNGQQPEVPERSFQPTAVNRPQASSCRPKINVDLRPLLVDSVVQTLPRWVVRSH